MAAKRPRPEMAKELRPGKEAGAVEGQRWQRSCAQAKRQGQEKASDGREAVPRRRGRGRRRPEMAGKLRPGKEAGQNKRRWSLPQATVENGEGKENTVADAEESIGKRCNKKLRR
jgi:hypothetical protein